MAVTGPPEWRPGRWLPALAAVVFTLQAVTRLGAPDRDLWDLALGLAASVLAVTAVLVQLPRRVRVDDVGVHVRGTGWRTVDVTWADVVDIRSHRPERPGSPLVVVTHGGRELPTGLHPVEHRSLPRHWRARVGGLPVDPSR